MLQVEERLALLREMLESVNPNLIMVELDPHFELVRSNAPDYDMWCMYFTYAAPPEGFSEPDHAFPEPAAPWVFTNTLGMTWMSECVLEEGRIQRIIVMGPVFLDDYAPKQIEHRLSRHNLSFSLMQPLMQTVQRMPVVSLHRLFSYGIMLHRCLTGKTCTMADFTYPDLPVTAEPPEEYSREHLGHYRTETEILRIVEEGNVRYNRENLNFLKLSGNIDRKIGGDTEFLRRAKNTVLVFVTLCSRTAIRGGLSPENAFHMCDQYIDLAERAENISKLTEISHKMFDDFVRQVHRVKVSSGSGMSPQIIDACSYITLHAAERIDIHQLALRAGYADYYFSTKFKKETGKSIRDYIMEQKILLAQELLKDTSLKIGDITLRLGFESQSHLSEVFLRQTGMTPSKWRAAQKQQSENAGQ